MTVYSLRPIAPCDSAPSPSPAPVGANPHLRWHPLRGEWVAYAAFRQNRPFMPPPQFNPLAPSTDPDNPTELPAGDYDVAVFDNRFPSLTLDSCDAPEVSIPSAPAIGKCEVVVFTTDPAASLHSLSVERIGLLLQVWADRTARAAATGEIRYVLAFENRGAEVGVTLHHPHGQLYCYGFVPPVPQKMLEREQAFHAETGRNLLCEMAASEIDLGQRVIYQNAHAVAFVPACARYPYEVWVMPVRHADSFAALDAAQRHGLAQAIKAVVMKYERLWNRPFPYLMAWYQAPTDGKPHVETQLHAEFYPKYPCVVIGGGPTALSAAYHLGQDTLLLDRNPTAGGWCRSVEEGGFTFDYAGHIMFSNDPYVLKLYSKLLGSNLHWQNREAWVYSKNVYTRYPFQGALYGLPPQVITECISGAIEARYGAPKQEIAPAPVAGALAQPVTDCCADGGMEVPAAGQAAAGPVAAPAQPANFEAFIYQVWGAGIARHFAIPYNKKLWTVPLSDMETSWLGGRVPLPDLTEIIQGALEPVGKPMGPNARFGYPLRGGFQALVQGFLPFIEGKVENDAEVTQVRPGDHVVALADGRRFRYDHLISTMALPDLVRVIGQDAPEPVRKAAKGLKHISIRCVNLGIARANITDKHWIYYPEDAIFHRIFVQGNASPHCNPPGGFGLTCEISYSPWKPLPVDGDALIERCIEDCIKVGIINADDRVSVSNQVDMPYAYVVYDHARAANVATVKQWLAQHDILLAGRYSEWEYYNSDHAFIAGKKAAEAVLAARSLSAERSAARE